MKRGDLVVGVLPGEYRKPRPTLIIQSDLFNDGPFIVACPLTSHLIEAVWFRILIHPGRGTGLSKPSQIQIDKMMVINRERFGATIGHIDRETMSRVDRAIQIWLGLETPRLPS